MRASLESYPELARFLTGAPRRWSDLRISAAELTHLCDAEDLAPLCVHHLSRSEDSASWPESLVRDLDARARIHMARELARQREVGAVLRELAHAGVRPILMKGTALAYTVYDSPVLRPREDTYLLVAETDVDTARNVLSLLGYAATPLCHDLFCQFEMQRTDQFAVTHAFDVHWQISTQPVFRGVVAHVEAAARARCVPALGNEMKALGPIDALLLACIHPVMHHRGELRTLWALDMHLLAGTLSAEDFAEFAAEARRKAVAAVCAAQLRQAQRLFGTSIPTAAFERLDDASGEPSAEYLASERRWRHELVSSMRAEPSLGSRIERLRGVLAPPRDYMLATYGLRGKALGEWLLPALYLHRNLRGAWKILSGKK
jgi:hypothetical protein